MPIYTQLGLLSRFLSHLCANAPGLDNPHTSWYKTSHWLNNPLPHVHRHPCKLLKWGDCLPLKMGINWIHQSMSCLISPMSHTLWELYLSFVIPLMSLQMNTLPPKTMDAAQFNFPTKDWSCFFDAHIRLERTANSSLSACNLCCGGCRHIAIVSNSTPK